MHIYINEFNKDQQNKHILYEILEALCKLIYVSKIIKFFIKDFVHFLTEFNRVIFKLLQYLFGNKGLNS